MTELPIKPRLNRYAGGKQHLKQKAMAENATARKIADHLNKLILDDPAELQQHLFSSIANDLGVTVAQVRSAIGWKGARCRPHGSNNAV
jgi:hypothetical protein